MKIKIHSKHVDFKLKAAMHSMCGYALARLGISSRITKNLNLTIHMGHHATEGEARVARDANRYRPRDFKIIIDHHRAEIDDYGRTRTDTEWGHEILKTLAHELVHVKQYVLGELSYRTHGMIWKKVTYAPDNIFEYFETPFEIEAYGREKGLLIAFLARWSEIEEELGMNV